MSKYRVGHHSEEFFCAGCGEPVMVGDMGYEAPNQQLFCSRRCSEESTLPEYLNQEYPYPRRAPRSWPETNPMDAPSPPPVFHPGGAHRYGGRFYQGSGRLHHHGLEPTHFHPGGGVRYDGDWHPGGGHYEANNPYFAPAAMQYVAYPTRNPGPPRAAHVRAAGTVLKQMEEDYRADPSSWNLAGLCRQKAYVDSLTERAMAANPYFAPAAMQYVAYPGPHVNPPRRPRCPRCMRRLSRSPGELCAECDQGELLEPPAPVFLESMHTADDVPVTMNYWAYDRRKNLLGTFNSNESVGNPLSYAKSRFGPSVFKVMASELEEYEAFLAGRRLAYDWLTDEVYYDPKKTTLGAVKPPRDFVGDAVFDATYFGEQNPGPFAWPGQNPCQVEDVNPGPPVKLSKTEKARYHHLKVADVSKSAAKSRYSRFRTGRWRGGAKGILAVYGVRKSAGPRGGRTELYQLLFPKDQYTVPQAERWAEDHGFDVHEVVAARPSPKRAAAKKRRRRVA